MVGRILKVLLKVRLRVVGLQRRRMALEETKQRVQEQSLGVEMDPVGVVLGILNELEGQQSANQIHL